jgi:hypothetical protein
MVLAPRILAQLLRLWGSLYLPPPGLSWREWRAVQRAAQQDLVHRTYQQGLQMLLRYAPDPARQQALRAAYAASYSEYAIARFGPLAPYFPGNEDQIPVHGVESGATRADPSSTGAYGREDPHLEAPDR